MFFFGLSTLTYSHLPLNSCHKHPESGESTDCWTNNDNQCCSFATVARPCPTIGGHVVMACRMKLDDLPSPPSHNELKCYYCPDLTFGTVPKLSQCGWLGYSRLSPLLLRQGRPTKDRQRKYFSRKLINSQATPSSSHPHRNARKATTASATNYRINFHRWVTPKQHLQQQQ